MIVFGVFFSLSHSSPACENVVVKHWCTTSLSSKWNESSFLISYHFTFNLRCNETAYNILVVGERNIQNMTNCTIDSFTFS